MAHQGKQVARGLVLNDPGDSDTTVGWRGALQVAATVTGNHPDVLRIADEIYQAAHDLQTTAAVRGYAASTLATLPDGPGHWLLRGMLEQLDVMEL